MKPDALASIDDDLDRLLSEYTDIMSDFAAFGSIVFAASAFMLLRGLGIVRDDSFIRPRGWSIGFLLILAAGLLITMDYVTRNSIVAFRAQVVYPSRLAENSCWIDLQGPLPRGLDWTSFHFETCFRPAILSFVQFSFITTVGTILAVLLWFGFIMITPKRSPGSHERQLSKKTSNLEEDRHHDGHIPWWDTRRRRRR